MRVNSRAPALGAQIPCTTFHPLGKMIVHSHFTHWAAHRLKEASTKSLSITGLKTGWKQIELRSWKQELHIQDPIPHSFRRQKETSMSICSCTHNSMYHSYASGCVMCGCTLTPDQVDAINSNADQILE